MDFNQCHSSSIVYNPVASDYAVIHAVSIPEDGSGGDTIWASGYEVYDRLSPPMKALFDGMTGLQQRVSLHSSSKLRRRG